MMKKKKWRIRLPGIVEGSDFVDEKGDGISYIVAMVVRICCGRMDYEA